MFSSFHSYTLQSTPFHSLHWIEWRAPFFFLCAPLFPPQPAFYWKFPFFDKQKMKERNRNFTTRKDNWSIENWILPWPWLFLLLLLLFPWFTVVMRRRSGVNTVRFGAEWWTSGYKTRVASAHLRKSQGASLYENVSQFLFFVTQKWDEAMNSFIV